VPKLHIASIGIEKIIPRLEHLAVFVRLLVAQRPRLAGDPVHLAISVGPGLRRDAVVLVDNGRSERLGMAEFWTSLKCIRCGACMNTCPVYRRSAPELWRHLFRPDRLIIDRRSTRGNTATCHSPRRSTAAANPMSVR